MSTEIIKVPLYDTEVRIPKDYLKGYSYINFYPGVLEGFTAYGGIVEQRVQALVTKYFDHLTKIINANPTFIDIGAACGVYSILAQRWCRQIHAFEPVRRISQLLQENLDNNNVFYRPSVYVHNVAINSGDTDHAYVGKWGTHRIRLETELSIDNEAVNCRALDSYDIQGNVIKIDVEGMAGEVCTGGMRTISQSDVIFVEIHNQGEYDSVVENMKGHGFNQQWVTESHIVFVKKQLPMPDKIREELHFAIN